MKIRGMIQKCFIAVFCMLLATGICLPVSAADTVSPMPVDVRVKWYKLTELNSLERGDEKLTLDTAANGRTYKLYLSFPAEGGIRLYGDKSGFFEPSSLQKISYKESGGDLIMSASGSTSVKLRRKSGAWAFDIYDGSQLVNRITGSQLAVGFDRNNEIAKARIEGTVSSGEVFTGLGERFDGVVRNGKSSLLWNADVLKENLSADADKSMSYTNVPLLHSTNGYSLFFNSSYAINADIGKSSDKKYTMEAYGPIMDFYFWTGGSQQRLCGYTGLTGNTVIPPKWAFSYWAGNSAKYWRSAGDGKHLDLLQYVLDNYERLGTPLAAIYGEGTPEKDNKAYSILKKYGTRMLGWWDSGVWSRETLMDYLPGYSSSELPSVNVLLNDGIGYHPISYIDFTHPLAEAAVDAEIKKFLSWGQQGAMVDIADCIPDDASFYNGKTGSEMHNLYAYFYTKTFSDVFKKYWGDDYVCFARAGYAGSQANMCSFLGDHPTNFMGLKQSLSGALSMSTSGYSIWGSDIGGLGNSLTDTLTPDLYRRWLQWSAFNPLMRAHGISERNPWNYGEETERDFQQYYWLRENIVNLLYSGAIASNKTSVAMTQPLINAYPAQTALRGIEDEYLFCGEILVSPVTTEYAASRQITLPSGNWTNFWTGRNVTGGKTFTTAAAESTIPLFLRAGAVIPLRLPETLKLCESMLDMTPVEALMITPATGHRDLTVYKDENTTLSFSTDRPGNGITTVQAKSGCTSRAIIAKGISASGVTVDGKALSLLDSVFSGGSVGYAVDKVENTTTIWLAEGTWNKLELTNGAGVAVNLAENRTVESNNSTDSNQPGYVTDSDPTTAWSAGSKSGVYLTVDLGKSKTVSNVQFTWGYNYANSYKIELSENGNDWTTAYQTDKGTGNEEKISLSSASNGRYLRISEIGKAQTAPAELYDLRVYGTELEYPDVKAYQESDGSAASENIGLSENTNNITENGGDQQDAESSWFKRIIRRKKIISGYSVWIPIIGGVAGAAIIAAVVIILVRRRKKKAKI